MLHKLLPAALLSSLVVFGLAACADTELDTEFDTDAQLREVIFDATEVEAELAADPDALFFIDMRDPTLVYVFDQRSETLDFEHFLVQCPTMVAPMPMIDYAMMLGIELDKQLWTIQSAPDEGDDEGFRAPGTFTTIQADMNCHSKMCDDGGSDCSWICE